MARSPAKKTKTKINSTSDPQLDPAAEHHADLTFVDYPDARWMQKLRKKSLGWFEQNQRVLPWRTQPSAYRVWISEIMLQQTQVQTVVEYFERFVGEFPTIKSLANAPLSKVLSLWEGLGYYRRARNLHAAAKYICQHHNGQFPLQFDQVLELPGIGRYTAGAILSISQDQILPILEGNTYRLFARLLALNVNPREREPEKLLWQFAADLLPGKRSLQRPGQLNQALMEIGSEICKPQNPDCQNCPLHTICPTHELGLQSEIPKSGKKVKYEERRQALLLIESDSNRLLVRKCQADEWWSGLWDFVRVDVDPGLPDSPIQHIQSQVRSQFDLDVVVSDPPLFTFKHAVTKYRITLDCFHVRSSMTSKKKGLQAKSMRQIDRLPLNVAARKAFQHLHENR